MADPYRDGQLMREFAILKRELDETRLALDDMREQQEKSIKRINEAVEEWEGVRKMAAKIRGRVGALVLSAVIGIPGAATAIAVQWVRYEQMTGQVETLSRRLSYDPDEERSVPNQMAKVREDVKTLTSELRGWQRHQETRIDNVNERTKTLETTTVRRRARVRPPP